MGGGAASAPSKHHRCWPCRPSAFCRVTSRRFADEFRGREMHSYTHTSVTSGSGVCQGACVGHLWYGLGAHLVCLASEDGRLHAHFHRRWRWEMSRWSRQVGSNSVARHFATFVRCFYVVSTFQDWCLVQGCVYNIPLANSLL